MNFTASATCFPPSRLLLDTRTAPEELTIQGAQVRSLPECQPGSRVHVLEGTLWITQEGDVNDYLVGAGEEFVCTRAGRVVVESLTTFSRFVVEAADA